MNDYRAQYVRFTYEKWEMCNVALQGITNETRAILKSMCYGSLCSLDVDDMWDLFESLAWYQWHHEIASESFVYPSPISYDLHTHSPLVCSYCQSFNHDASSCPYYDIFDACYVKLNAIIETTTEGHECFVGKMREYGRLHEIDPSPSSPRLVVSLNDNY